jgi:hypothetical protein
MWKLLLGFIVFAAIGLFVLKKAGGDVNMGGETHDVSGGSHAASAPAEPTSAAAPAASAMPEPAASATPAASAASQ